jgi:hypothetical protein
VAQEAWEMKNQWSKKLEVRGLWAAVDPSDAEFQVDRMALDVICCAMPPEMVTTLATRDTALKAWESIKTMRIGDEQISLASS